MSLLFTKSGLTLALLCPCISFADSVLDTIDVNGFVGIGGSYSINSDDRYQNLVESGAQLRAGLPGNLSLNSQLLYRDYNDGSDSGLSLDYASLDWSFHQGVTENTLSLGRFKANGGIYSNTRDVPFTRPGIFLARSLYSETYRSLYEHIDGISFHSELPTDWGDFSAQLGLGKSDLDENFNSNILAGIPENSEIEADDSVVLDLRYRTFSFLSSFTYRKVKAGFDASKESVEELERSVESSELQQTTSESLETISSNLDFDSYTLGFLYQRGSFEFTLEGRYQNVDTSFNDQPDIESYGYYLQGRYFLSPAWALMLRYDWRQDDVYQRTSADQISSSEQSEISLVANKVQVVSLGTVWNFKEDWQLAIEGHKELDKETVGLIQLAWRF